MECLHNYGVTVDEELCTKIQAYIGLLLRWNRTISLTTVLKPEEMVRFHFGESMFAFTKGIVSEGRLADVGTGAGFPGLPLKLACRAIHLTLVESNVRKCVFLKEAARALGLEGEVHIENARMEELGVQRRDLQFDYVTARAVGHFGEVLSFSKLALVPGGRVVLWVGEDDAERIRAEYSSEWKWFEPERIPRSERRLLLWGEMI